MKVLLQNKKTRLFAQENGEWAISIEDAYGFINSDKAIDFALERQMAEVHVVLWFKEQNYCITLPFQQEDPDAPSGSVPEAKPGEREHL